MEPVRAKTRPLASVGKPGAHASSSICNAHARRAAARCISNLRQYVAALVYEQSGSWVMGFYGSAVMALIAAALAYGLRNSQATVRAKAKIAVTA